MGDKIELTRREGKTKRDSNVNESTRMDVVNEGRESDLEALFKDSGTIASAGEDMFAAGIRIDSRIGSSIVKRTSDPITLAHVHNGASWGAQHSQTPPF
jgi:hypothetical protein